MNRLEKYREIIDEAYENYLTGVKEVDYNGYFIHLRFGQKPLSKEAFVERCKTDGDFSRQWKLKIEEKEYSLAERGELFRKIYPEKSVDDFAPNGMEVQSLTHQLTTRYNNAGIPINEINVYYQPKKSVEYIETKITILPTGSGFQQKI